MFEKQFTLKHVIKNFPGSLPDYSPSEEHFGVGWRLSTKQIDDQIAVFLHCHKHSKDPWSVKTSFKFSGAGGNGNDTISTYTFEKCEGYGFSKYNSLVDVLKNHRDTNNSVAIQCHVTITGTSGIVPKRKISFEAPKKNLTDVVLKIGDEKFNVSKVILATHSPYFEALFFGNFAETKKKVIELKEVNPDDFQNLLDIIHGESEVQAENVENMLQLADQLDVPLVRKKCEKFLMSDGTDKKLKLRLSDQYSLEKLKEECLKAIGSLEQLKQFIPTDVSDLGHSTVSALLQKCVNKYK